VELHSADVLPVVATPPKTGLVQVHKAAIASVENWNWQRGGKTNFENLCRL